MRAKPITVDGVTYPSLHQASVATGVPVGTLFTRQRTGRPVSARRQHPGPKGSPIIVDGRLYRTTMEAAAALGVTRAGLQNALFRGGTIRGKEVRRPSELDLVLAEIDERNRQPYQFSRP